MKRPWRLVLVVILALVCLPLESTMGQQKRRRGRARRAGVSANRNSEQQQAKKERAEVSGPVRGDTHTRIFYWPACPDYEKVPVERRTVFGTGEEAEKAGYKPAKNCP